jgi:hypothetical protein
VNIQASPETPKVSSAEASVPAVGAPPTQRANMHALGGYPRKKFSESEAQDDLQRILDATGTKPTQEILADIWGVSQATVSRWQAKWDHGGSTALGRIFRNMQAEGAYGGSRALGH